MPKKDPRIDAYIAKSADFAQPILTHLRKLVHAACPGVEETMKWQTPTFMHHGILAGMAAFKNHCAFNFWKGKLLIASEPALAAKAEEAMGHFGRITSLDDLPKAATITRWIKQAAKLNEEGIKVPKKRPARPREVSVPEYLLKALRKNKAALTTFEKFPPSHRREYVEWIVEAKTEPTRDKRIATALEWMAEGKSRNWKYSSSKK
jgi:uncharacterized protein YdeI (YjbR/CyaY-like superfamily)